MRFSASSELRRGAGQEKSIRTQRKEEDEKAVASICTVISGGKFVHTYQMVSDPQGEARFQREYGML
jgi:hypothetical protein